MTASSLLLSVALLASASARDFALTEPVSLFEAQLLFKDWSASFRKDYANAAEESKAFSTFLQSLDSVVKQNSRKDKAWTAALNRFSDMTWEEFKSFHGLNLMEGQNCSATGEPMRLTDFEATARKLASPEAIDWRKAGAVSPVKNQGGCGSCWTFSTTGAMESHHFLNTGDMLSLSEQQLVDCAGNFENNGCSGGLPSHAFQYIHYAGGIMSEQSYPYTAKDGECSFDVNKVEAIVYRAFNITTLDEDELEQAVGMFGPVSVAFQVASDFKQYESGVYSSEICQSGAQDVNHAVLAVGYDATEDGLPYWIIKNSWGTDWGMDGYFYMEKGVNMCGVSTCCSFPFAA